MNNWTTPLMILLVTVAVALVLRTIAMWVIGDIEDID